MSKIAILLPYKESYTKEQAGAASLYVSEFYKYSKFKELLKVYGDHLKNHPLTKNYVELSVKGYSFSKTKNYLESFLKQLANKSPEIIEIHNRPNYVTSLKNRLKAKFILIFHNDPLFMNGSKTRKERLELINCCTKIIFISDYIKSQFFKDIEFNKYLNKTEVIYHGIDKNKIFPPKKKLITFVGKLNRAKGFDIFCKAIDKILNEFNDWKACAVGNEERRKIYYYHKNFKEYGFLDHKKTIAIFKKSEIAVIPSLWNEPYGRTAMEASSNGCYAIVSNKGGLSETANHINLIDNINSNKIYLTIKKAILNKKHRLNLQKKTFYNTRNILKNESKKFDDLRKNLLNKQYKSNKIINIYYSGLKINHRIYNISIGKKLSSGFIKNNYDVLDISDRDYEKNNLFQNSFSEYLLKTIKNYQPSILIFGHSSLITCDLLSKIKKLNPNLKIAEWNEDYLGKEGPDSKKNFKNLKLKEDLIDYFFVTTAPDKLYGKLKNCYYMHIPCDKNIEFLTQFKKNNPIDIFFAMSHGVNRGVLKKGKKDSREKVLDLINKYKEIKTNFFGYRNLQPIWNEDFYEEISKCSMALNLSRGKPVKHYSSNRIASYLANGLLTFIHRKSKFNTFFNNDEIVFYNSDTDLIKKIFYYKKNPKKLKKIAQKGYLKYHKLYNSKKVAKSILKIING